ncbi:MAG: SBBP repeat-containing protein [Bacteroidia bacterium]
MNKAILFYTLFSLCITTATSQSLDWAKGTGGSGDDEGKSVAIDHLGNVYSTGYFSGTVDFDPGMATFNLTAQGEEDIFVQKQDPLGNLIWAKSMGGNLEDMGRAIAVDTLENVYIRGYFNGTVDFDPGTGTQNITASSTDMFIEKLDANGDFVWVKTFATNISQQFFIRDAKSIAIDNSGDVYVTGTYSGQVDFDPGAGTTFLDQGGIFILKLNKGGDLVWVKGIRTDSRLASGNGIVIDNSGNITTTGYFYGVTDFDPGTAVLNLGARNQRAIYVQKLDASGNFMWAIHIEADLASSIALDKSGDIYVAGWFSGFVDFDPGPGESRLIVTNEDDAFVLKLNQNGEYVWAKSFGGAFGEYPHGLAVDDAKNVLVTGYFDGNLTIDKNSSFVRLSVQVGSSSRASDLFLVKLDSVGELVWSERIGGIEDDLSNAIVLDRQGGIFTVGSFSETADFDPDSILTNNLASNGAKDIFVTKWEEKDRNVSLTPEYPSKVTIYPNPNNGSFRIEIPKGTRATHIAITDKVGRVVFESLINKEDQTVHLKETTPGLYYVTLTLPNNELLYSKMLLK